MEVALQVFAYREPHLTDTLSAIEGQETPGWLDVRHEVWVTPDGPPEDDDTWRQAEAHQQFRARLAPRGKLSARNAAHGAASARGVDAIVAWDADAPPLRQDTLTRLVEPLHLGAGGASGRPVSPWSVLGVLTNAASWAHDAVMPHMNGQLNAFTADAWEEAGPFHVAGRAGVNESSRISVWREEEYHFRKRIEWHAPVVDVKEARVYNDLRRYECSLRRPFVAFGEDVPDYCRSRAGGDTFQPARSGGRW